jgi:hypothetical protein
LKLAAGVTLKYTYPEEIPEHKPLPKKKQVYDDCSNSNSDVEIETNSNQDWIQQTNFKVKEGSAYFNTTSKPTQNNDYNDLLEELLSENVKPAFKESVPAIADYALSESSEEISV